MKTPVNVQNRMLAAQLNVAQRAGKVEAPKPAEKPKFRSCAMFVQGRTAMPGEARKMASADYFKAHCERFGVTPTRRQAAKFIQRRGALWNAVNKPR